MKKGTLFDALKNNPFYQTVKGPASLSFRYLSEDFPCGIGAMSNLADMLHVEAPHITALADMGALYLGIPRKAFLTPKDLSLLKQIAPAKA